MTCINFEDLWQFTQTWSIALGNFPRENDGKYRYLDNIPHPSSDSLSATKWHQFDLAKLASKSTASLFIEEKFFQLLSSVCICLVSNCKHKKKHNIDYNNFKWIFFLQTNTLWGLLHKNTREEKGKHWKKNHNHLKLERMLVHDLRSISFKFLSQTVHIFLYIFTVRFAFLSQTVHNLPPCFWQSD